MAQSPIIYVFDSSNHPAHDTTALDRYLESHSGATPPPALSPQEVFDTLINDALSEEYLTDSMTDNFGADGVSLYQSADEKPALTIAELKKELERALGLQVAHQQVSGPTELTPNDVTITSATTGEPVATLLTTDDPNLAHLSLSKEQVVALMERGQEAHHLLELIADFLVQEHAVYYNPRLSNPINALLNRCASLETALGPDYMKLYEPLVQLRQVFEGYQWTLDATNLSTLNYITVAGSFYSKAHQPWMPPAFVSLGHNTTSTYHGWSMADLVSEAFARKEGLNLTIVLGYNDYYHA